jgi:predicted phage terminase large subunit-like protein
MTQLSNIPAPGAPAPLVDPDDIDDLIDDDEEFVEELTLRERRRLKLKETIPLLEKLARALPRMERYAQAQAMKLFDDAEKTACELSLATFYKCAWPHLDPAPYKHNWHVDATAEQAERLITGETRRLIVNQPPRTGKSSLLSVVLPLWIWIQSEKGPMSGPQVKFLTASYGQSLSLKHSGDMRKIISSAWFQKHWGHRFKLAEDRNAVGFFENDKGGYRMSTSVGAGLTGQGGDFILIDDPANTQDVTSEAERAAVINWYTQSLSTRLNDPKTGVILLVMQRQHELDLTGFILETEPEMWDHFVLRMRYESNPFLEYDPRGYDENGEVHADMSEAEGTLLWPNRIPEMEVQKLEKTLGTYGASGQLQQRPEPKGGGIIRSTDWKMFPPEGQQEDWKKDGIVCWPPLEFIVASCDLAFTERQENDYSAMTMWGVWHDRTGAPKVVAMHAWQDRLSFNPLVTRIGNNCRKFKPDVLLIEAKAAGISAAQEIQRVYGAAEWSTVLVNPRGDKVSRAISIQGLFEEGLIYAPDRTWSQMLIDTCASFPKGQHDDLVDSTTQALRWMRDNGVIKRKEEYKRELFDSLPRPGDANADLPPYDV